jgi:hypothetical protein
MQSCIIKLQNLFHVAKNAKDYLVRPIRRQSSNPKTHTCTINIPFFFFFCGTGAWTQGLHLEHLHQPYFCDRVSQTVCPGWLQTMILLISASWVARIYRCEPPALGYPSFFIPILPLVGRTALTTRQTCPTKATPYLWGLALCSIKVCE